MIYTKSLSSALNICLKKGSAQFIPTYQYVKVGSALDLDANSTQKAEIDSLLLFLLWL